MTWISDEINSCLCCEVNPEHNTLITICDKHWERFLSNHARYVKINEKSSWINIKDRQPTDAGSYLVVKRYLDAPFTENGYDETKSFWTESFVKIDRFCYNYWQDGGDVTHWKELPELPD